MRIRFTRKPGELLTGRGSRLMAPTKARARSTASAAVPGVVTTSTRSMRATGLKKCSPTNRSGRSSTPASSSRGMLEVLVARTAVGFIRGSRSRYRSVLAAAFSKMASMTTSARATPPPVRSGVRRSRAACSSRGVFSFFRNSFAARATTLASRTGSTSWTVTSMPWRAHQAAISPPMAPPPTTWTNRAGASPGCARAFRRSWSRNTRTRLRAVVPVMRLATDWASALYMASGMPPNRSHSSMRA